MSKNETAESIVREIRYIVLFCCGTHRYRLGHILRAVADNILEGVARGEDDNRPQTVGVTHCTFGNGIARALEVAPPAVVDDISTVGCRVGDGISQNVKSPLHVVCDYSNQEVVDIVTILTSYIPNRPWWETPSRRGKVR